MNIDYEKEIISIRGKGYPLGDFKKWFILNYQPLLAKYHVKRNIYDWQSILTDVQQNGIIELYESENK